MQQFETFFLNVEKTLKGHRRTGTQNEKKIYFKENNKKSQNLISSKITPPRPPPSLSSPVSFLFPG